jgi:hypothetical protein
VTFGTTVHIALRIQPISWLAATTLTAPMLLPFDGLIRSANGSRDERGPRRKFDQIYGLLPEQGMH